MDDNWAVTIGAAVGGGIVSTLVLSWYAQRVGYGPMWDVDHVAALLPPLIFFLLGALPVALLLRYRSVTPAVLYAIVVGLWIRAEADPGPGDPLVGLAALVGPLTVVLMLLVGGVEYWVRSESPSA